MKPRYLARKALFATINTTDTLTDQAGAAETNINRIVKSMGIHGQVPQGREPLYGDFSTNPDDLRGFIERARSLREHVNRLPDELKHLTDEELNTLTPAQFAALLKKPEQPKEPTTEPTPAPAQPKESK